MVLCKLAFTLLGINGQLLVNVLNFLDQEESHLYSYSPVINWSNDGFCESIVAAMTIIGTFKNYPASFVFLDYLL